MLRMLFPLDQGFYNPGIHGSPSEWLRPSLDSLGHRDDHPPQGGIVELLLQRCPWTAWIESSHGQVAQCATRLVLIWLNSQSRMARALETQPGLVH